MLQVVLGNKAGVATQNVARILCGFEAGDKIPTVAVLTEQCDTARGNIQQALTTLKETGAIALEPHGQNGTILTAIDYLQLANICGAQNLVGAMPLPYTKRYEGLATGLFSLLNRDGLSNLIAFMRGSEGRVQTLLDGRANYCVMSHMAYLDYRRRGMPLREVMELGPESYVGRHLLWLRPGFDGNWKGCRVGLDNSSADQSLLTQRYFAGKPVVFEAIQYTQILPMLEEGKLDAGIWNEDDFSMHINQVHCQPLVLPEEMDRSNTSAAIVVQEKDTLVPRLLKKYLTKERLLDIQQLVMQDKLAARY